jgi:hypothetical protein
MPYSHREDIASRIAGSDDATRLEPADQVHGMLMYTLALTYTQKQLPTFGDATLMIR